MAELMMAIIILGLGLLMVATMFPIAWSRARDLAEFTKQSTGTDSARTTVRLLTTVSHLGTDGMPVPSSFRGDLEAMPDTFVHVLHLGNALAGMGAGGIFGPVGDFVSSLGDDVNLQTESPMPEVQIAFGERFVPPLPAPPGDIAGNARWAQQLGQRRFAWSVLHKLDVVPSSLEQERSFTMYFVTLRRTQSTHRFARQDPLVDTPSMTPQALPAEEDVMLPAPWLVNLKVLGNWGAVNGNPPREPRGIPSEAVANPEATEPGKLIGRMLQPGSVLIDRITGGFYTVKKHRFTGAGDAYDRQATVTLDQEINNVDLGLQADDSVMIGVRDLGTDVTLGGDLRDYWVFPPPVVRGAGDAAFPEFDGKQPVVGVEVRPMFLRP